MQIASESDLIQYLSGGHDGPVNIAFASILLGLVETRLLRDCPDTFWDDDRDCWSLAQHAANADTPTPGFGFSIDEVSQAMTLADEFARCCREHELPDGVGHVSRANIQALSNLVWNRMPSALAKDRLHIQSIASLMDPDKRKRHLDCFGVAVATLAACQIMELNTVSLALSEDHAFLVFCPTNDMHTQCTAELTWHGKGLESRRASEISSPEVDAAPFCSYLYLIDRHGQLPTERHYVVCTRPMVLAAIANSITPLFGLTPPRPSPHPKKPTYCLPLARFQSKLLFALYRAGHLDRYPIGLCSFASCLSRQDAWRPLYRAVLCVRHDFQNTHPFPYFHLAELFRQQQCVLSMLRACASGAAVLSRYKLTKEDDEQIRYLVQTMYTLTSELIQWMPILLHMGSASAIAGSDIAAAEAVASDDVITEDLVDLFFPLHNQTVSMLDPEEKDKVIRQGAVHLFVFLDHVVHNTFRSHHHNIPSLIRRYFLNAIVSVMSLDVVKCCHRLCTNSMVLMRFTQAQRPVRRCQPKRWRLLRLLLLLLLHLLWLQLQLTLLLWLHRLQRRLRPWPSVVCLAGRLVSWVQRNSLFVVQSIPVRFAHLVVLCRNPRVQSTHCLFGQSSNAFNHAVVDYRFN
jgi:hypothetical protein